MPLRFRGPRPIIKIRSQSETFKQIASTQGYMYILLGAVVFVAPQFSDNLGGASIAKITAALLYVIGACFSLVQTIPILMNANAAADRIVQLEATLRSTVSVGDDEIVAPTSFENDRDAQRHVQLHGPSFGRSVPYRADRLHPALRRAGFHHRRQRFGKIDVFAGAGRALPSRIRRNPAGRHARQQGDAR